MTVIGVEVEGLTNESWKALSERLPLLGRDLGVTFGRFRIRGGDLDSRLPSVTLSVKVHGDLPDVERPYHTMGVGNSWGIDDSEGNPVIVKVEEIL